MAQSLQYYIISVANIALIPSNYSQALIASTYYYMGSSGMHEYGANARHNYDIMADANMRLYSPPLT
jgi:hypothetical protein